MTGPEIYSWPALQKHLRVGRSRIQRWIKLEGFPAPRFRWRVTEGTGVLRLSPHWCATEIMHWWQDFDHKEEISKWRD